MYSEKNVSLILKQSIATKNPSSLGMGQLSSVIKFVVRIRGHLLAKSLFSMLSSFKYLPAATIPESATLLFLDMEIRYNSGKIAKPLGTQISNRSY